MIVVVCFESVSTSRFRRRMLGSLLAAVWLLCRYVFLYVSVKEEGISTSLNCLQLT